MTIGYEDSAKDALVDAVAYYEELQPGLGRRFASEHLAFEATLLLTPFAQLVKGNVRSRMMRRFPYRFFYVVDEARQHIQVLAVLHASRDPGLWPGA